MSLFTYRFRLVPEAFQMLHDDVERCMRRAIEVEEKIDMDDVTNFKEVSYTTVLLWRVLFKDEFIVL